MKGIEWIKLTANMCEDEKMRLLDAMEEKDAAFYLWIRLLLQAGKVNDNGLIYLKEDVPYTYEMLSIIFNRPLVIIKKVFKILESFKMIEIYENNIIRICNWEKHQNIEGMKRVREIGRERVKKFREKKKKEAVLEENESFNKDENDNKALNIFGNDNALSDTKNCNADVTLQREKREIDNKNKKKNTDKRERKEKNEFKDSEGTMEVEKIQEIDGYNDVDSILKIASTQDCEGNEFKGKYDQSKGKTDLQALNIQKSLEESKVKIKGLTLILLKELLAIHQEKYVKMAIEKAVGKNKFDMNYINGILKNWFREGYPKTYEEMEFDVKNSPNLRFINFEPRQYDYNDLEKKLLGW